MKIEKITILKNFGADICILEFDGLSNMWPGTTKLQARFECQYGTGEEYCSEKFPDIPLEVIQTVL